LKLLRTLLSFLLLTASVYSGENNFKELWLEWLKEDSINQELPIYKWAIKELEKEKFSDAFLLKDKKDLVKQQIIAICKEINAPIPVVLAIARIESNFNTKSVDRGGSCVGIYQMKNGFGGCVGDDRYCLEKTTKALWKIHATYKQRWLKQIDSTWNDFYYYGIHQKGFAGFVEIYKNRHKKLNEISAVRRNSILASKPSSANWNDVNDWWCYFENRFYKIYNQYK